MATGNIDQAAVGTLDYDSGSGWTSLGFIKDLTVRWNGNVIDHMNAETYPLGTDARVRGRVDIEFDFGWEEITNYAVWNMILHGGTVTNDSAANTAVTDEAVTLTGVYWVPLLYWYNFDQDCVVTVTNTAKDTTYTINSDYYLDRRNGHVKRISTGLIGSGDSVYVNYYYDKKDGYRFNMMTDTTLATVKARLIKPLTDGKNWRYLHDVACFTAEGEINLSPGDTGTLAIQNTKLRMLRDTAGSPTYGEFGTADIYTP